MSIPKDDVSALKTLGQGATAYPRTVTPGLLETFPNAFPDRRYEVTFQSPEFTSLCPKTGQPDFGHITVRYIPDRRCVESKSLKLFLYSFRNANTFHEESVNTILDAIVKACAPRRAEVTGKFRPRGGIAINVTARYGGKLDE